MSGRIETGVRKSAPRRAFICPSGGTPLCAAVLTPIEIDPLSVRTDYDPLVDVAAGVAWPFKCAQSGRASLILDL
ncbi:MULTISPECIES: hypothetical protein [unclassified Beijerinckia]|uniref:hypothetical protein n=1 Tax=unclassified Beijerinckia TaxID=2638183 RepID=UPI0008956637|nr:MULTISPECIES: hypothetical protein [unclassified Beijerinckia]MDH7797593.1 hypothetical protein [Beijerinckia sp. GAS462]SEC91725.1 hypothetical protein SAMN05443249_3887 [Beijerinckia sp. 28-YEA-48]